MVNGMLRQIRENLSAIRQATTQIVQMLCSDHKRPPTISAPWSFENPVCQHGTLSRQGYGNGWWIASVCKLWTLHRSILRLNCYKSYQIALATLQWSLFLKIAEHTHYKWIMLINHGISSLQRKNDIDFADKNKASFCSFFLGNRLNSFWTTGPFSPPLSVVEARTCFISSWLQQTLSVKLKKNDWAVWVRHCLSQCF